MDLSRASRLAALSTTFAVALTSCSLVRPKDSTESANSTAVASVVQTPTPPAADAGAAAQSNSVLAGLPPVPAFWLSRPAGQPLFPQHRLVGYSGYPGAPGQGRLGVGDLDARVAEIVQLGPGYAAGRQVIPTLELIAVTVQGAPGPEGLYRSRATPDVIRQYLTAARKVGGMLLLNIQPGRADFVTEAKALEPWLSQPDVGLALDPEWRMGPGQVPMKVFGQVSGKELDDVAGYAADLVARHRLPEKAVVFHQLNPAIVREPAALQAHPGVALVKSVDGIGSARMKLETWKRLTTGQPAHIRPGFKLFFQEDRKFGPLMTPAEVLGLKPPVDYVLYE